MDEIDKLVEAADGCPQGADCNCPSFYCEGFVLSVPKAARRELAREAHDRLRGAIVNQDPLRGYAFGVLWWLREIAEEEE